MNLLDRITIEPGKCGGKPCIRRFRIRVIDVLEGLKSGMPASEILDMYPDLEPDDIIASTAFAEKYPLLPTGHLANAGTPD